MKSTIELAKEAVICQTEAWRKPLERFEALVRADQRKKDADACYTRAANWKDNAARAAKLCGDAITAMGET